MSFLKEAGLWINDVWVDRWHDIERFAKKAVRDPLLGSADDFWEDVQPDLMLLTNQARLILREASGLGVAAVVLLMAEFRAELTEAAQAVLARLQAKIEALKKAD